MSKSDTTPTTMVSATMRRAGGSSCSTRTLGPTPRSPPCWPRASAIGIRLDVRFMRWNRLEELVPDPRERPQLTFTTTWDAEYPSPSPLFGSAFDVAGIGSFPTTNYSLIGASDEQLAGWGYAVPSLPSVEPKIDECRGRIGPAQQQCWAELDQLLMLQIVPAIPALIEEEVRIVSDRVTRSPSTSRSDPSPRWTRSPSPRVDGYAGLETQIYPPPSSISIGPSPIATLDRIVPDEGSMLDTVPSRASTIQTASRAVAMSARPCPIG